MKRKGKTSQRTILFRRNVNRDNEEWAHFLEGYREWLMDWDMTTYGDDWHTAEDIVSEIYLTIIQEPLIINLRPNDTFRHTLITLCKHAHRDVTKPWRKGLMERLYEALRLTLRSRLGLLAFLRGHQLRDFPLRFPALLFRSQGPPSHLHHFGIVFPSRMRQPQAASKPGVRKPLLLLSKSIHNRLIQQKRQYAEANDAVRIKMRFIIPFRDNDLLEEITYSTQ